MKCPKCNGHISSTFESEDSFSAECLDCGYEWN
jgi:Zn ribbon nucleic-acid-binding protein